jgi:hypothetical protein
MYTTIRKATSSTMMICNDCGHAITMDTLCAKPLQGAKNMLSHVAAHNVSRALAVAQGMVLTETSVPVFN